MKAILRVLATAMAVAAAMPSLFCLAGDTEGFSYRPGEVLVKFKPAMRAAGMLYYRQVWQVQEAGDAGSGDIHHLKLPATMSVDDALALYGQDPAVVYVEPNYIYRSQALPNDPMFSQQWGLYNNGQIVSGYMGTAGADMAAAGAWNFTTGSDDVIVAVIDSGVDIRHPDLQGNVWVNSGEIAGNGIDDDGNGFVDDINGWDFVDRDNMPQDAIDHGTHVAGIIAARGDNGTGVSGAAWRARIMPLRFINAYDMGATSDAIQAIRYATANGARIINCSWGGAGYSTALRDVMAQSDALFVCAAGNNAADNDIAPFYPASYGGANLISVAASDQNDQLAWFSNYGRNSVEVAAPGIRVYSLRSGRQTLWQDDFNDLDIGDWATGGDVDNWAAVNGTPYSVTGLLAHSPGGTYPNGVDTWAVTPAFNLGAAAASRLTFKLIGRSQTGLDGLFVEVSTDMVHWQLPLVKAGSVFYNGMISGIFTYWTTVTVDLGAWDGQPQVFVRLRFQSDASTGDVGYFVDNMTLSAATGVYSGGEYQFMQGTSMAAGFVSGLAALMQAYEPDITPAEMKSLVVSSAAMRPALAGRLISDGRISAQGALFALSAVSLSSSAASSDEIDLFWTAKDQLQGDVVVERRTAADTVFTPVAQVSSAATTYTDNGLTAGTTYIYRLQAATVGGLSGYSNQAQATTLTAGSGSGGGGCFIGSVRP